MKTIVILFDEKKSYENVKAFDGKSAVELCIQNYKNFGYEVFTICGQKTVSELFAEINNVCQKNNADSVVFSFADCPFINKAIIEELIKTHYDYNAEYTFAEGYPNGFAPELLDKGIIGILSELAKTTAQNIGNQKITRYSVFDLIKTDINSFEIETVLAPVDWRLFRISFDCSKKENFVACVNFYEECKNQKIDVSKISLADAKKLSEIAVKTLSVIKTVPGFYNLQIAQKCKGCCSYCPYPECFEKKYGKNPVAANEIMPFEKCSQLIKNIADFSGEAVVGLSAWGECFNHPQLIKIIEEILSYSGLSVFIEADGNSIPDNFVSELKPVIEKAEERTNGWNKIMIAVSIDGCSNEICQSLRGKDFDVEAAVKKIDELEQVIPGCVYPQFVRMNKNESELEPFFRYWKEKANQSKGELIIQKHNSFAGLLESQEPADLSPLERCVCWHLRRDMTVLCNGDVPLCYCSVFEDITGNVFENGLEAVWKKFDESIKNHMACKYDSKCGGCNEFYTFNF